MTSLLVRFGEQAFCRVTIHLPPPDIGVRLSWIWRLLNLKTCQVPAADWKNHLNFICFLFLFAESLDFSLSLASTGSNTVRVVCSSPRNAADTCSELFSVLSSDEQLSNWTQLPWFSIVKLSYLSPPNKMAGWNEAEELIEELNSEPQESYEWEPVDEFRIELTSHDQAVENWALAPSPWCRSEKRF